MPVELLSREKLPLAKKILSENGFGDWADHLDNCLVWASITDDEPQGILVFSYYPEKAKRGLMMSACAKKDSKSRWVSKGLFHKAFKDVFSRTGILFIYVETNRKDIQNYLSRMGFEKAGSNNSGENVFVLFRHKARKYISG